MRIVEQDHKMKNHEKQIHPPLFSSVLHEFTVLSTQLKHRANRGFLDEFEW